MSSKTRNAPMKGRQRVAEKPKDFKLALKKLLLYCKKYWWLIGLAIVCVIAGSVLNLIGPSFIEDLTNEIAKALNASILTNTAVDINIDTVINITIILVILYVAGAILNLISGLTMTQITQRTTQKMRREIFRKVNSLPLKYLDSHSYGDVLSRVTNDVDLIGQTLNNSITTLVSSVALFLGSVIMMFVTNWIMALTAIASSLLGFVIMFIIMSKSQKYFSRQQTSLGQLNGHIEEIYSGHDVVNAYNGQTKAKQTFNKYNNALYTSGWKSQFLSGMMMPLMQFIGNFGYVAVCVVGALLVVNGTIGFGVVAAFIIYVRLFTQPLSQMAQAVTNLQSTAAATERVFEILDEKELADESNKTLATPTIKGNVEFEHVKFGYDAKDFDLPTQPVLMQRKHLKKGLADFKYSARAEYNPKKLIIKDFSLSVKAGQKVAIVGPTGAGKTTLVNLLMRFYETNAGTIKVDGIPTRNLNREQVHEMFSMVLQDTWLFGGTIKENIVYSKENVTDEQVVAACKAVGVDHFIRTLSNGYDTVIDENTTISAGQKQLLTIARAMVQNSPMLILDEATSSVDTRTEIIIQKAMDKLMEGRTSFVIAHRLSTIKNADKIIVMMHGDVIESGTHDELLAKNGVYADLYNSQFQEE